MHKSQGFGVGATRGPIVEYFKVLDEARRTQADSRPCFDGLDLTWTPLARRGERGARSIDAGASRGFDAATPRARRSRRSSRLDRALDALPDAGWRAHKQHEVERAGARRARACSSTRRRPTPRPRPGSRARACTATAINRSPRGVALRGVRFPSDGPSTSASPHARPAVDGRGAVERRSRRSTCPADAPRRRPYWLEAPPERGPVRASRRSARSSARPRSRRRCRRRSASTIGGRAAHG